LLNRYRQCRTETGRRDKYLLKKFRDDDDVMRLTVQTIYYTV